MPWRLKRRKSSPDRKQREVYGAAGVTEDKLPGGGLTTLVVPHAERSNDTCPLSTSVVHSLRSLRRPDCRINRKLGCGEREGRGLLKER